MAWNYYETPTGQSEATQASALRRIKNNLVTNGFSVVKSSDGTTYNSSGDQITTDSGAGSIAATGSFMIISSPGSAYQMCIQVGTTTNARVLVSNAGFSGGSPGATRVPTASDQQFVNSIGGGTDASPTYSQLFATDNTYRVYMAMGDSAENYDWWAATIPTGGGAPTTILGVWSNVAGSYPSADTDPRQYMVDYASGGVATLSRLTNSGGVGSPWARSGSAWRACPLSGGGIGSTAIASAAGLHGVTSDDVPAPCGMSVMMAAGPTYYGPKGVPSMPRWCLSAVGVRVNGHRLADGTTPTPRYWVRVGDLWLRGTSTVPNLS